MKKQVEGSFMRSKTVTYYNWINSRMPGSFWHTHKYVLESNVISPSTDTSITSLIWHLQLMCSAHNITYLPLLEHLLSSQCCGNGAFVTLELTGGSLGVRTSPAGPTTASGDPSPVADAGSPRAPSRDSRETITWPRTPHVSPELSSLSSRHWSEAKKYF